MQRAAFFGVQQADGNHFFRMTLTDAGIKTLQIYRLAPLNTHTNGHLDYSVRLRGEDLKTVSNTGKLCGISLSFFDAAGRFVSPGPLLDVGKAALWTHLSARVAIPPRATSVRIHLELRGATGTLDFDDLRAVFVE